MILLTGASGFIGQQLLLALVNKYGANDVLAFTSKPIANCKYLLHHNYQFDVNYFSKNGYESLIDTIIHAGAFIPKNSKQANDWENCNQNIYSTEKLLKANLSQLKKIIYLSTVDIYSSGNVISESSLIDPVSLYGYSKLYSEKLVEAWANNKEAKHQILRIGHVYGPGEEAYQKIIPITIKKIIDNEPVQIWGTGNELRAFIYISDVVRSILNALDLNENVGPINIVAERAISITELVKKIITVSGKSTNIEYLPNNLIGRNLTFDNSKMKHHLLQSEKDLDEGLLEEWCYMNEKNE